VSSIKLIRLEFDDCYYIANLMGSLASTLSHSPDSFDYDEEEAVCQNAAIAEIERYQRMDQWHPTYMNIISETALEVRKQLAFAGIKSVDHRLFMTYTREGTLETLRLKAFDSLIDLGALRIPPLAQYICHVMGNDPSPYIRHHLQMMFGRGLGMIALGDKKLTNNAIAADDMIIEDGSINDAEVRKAEVLAKETIAGAMTALKKELKDDALMKEAVWAATT
jgi:transcription initiation factor TFIID subunit 2